MLNDMKTISLDEHIQKMTIRQLKRLRLACRKKRANPFFQKKLRFVDSVVKEKQQAYYQKQASDFAIAFAGMMKRFVERKNEKKVSGI